MINENAKSRGRLIDFKEIQYGYRRVDPMHGVEYILDLLLLYKRHKGRKLTVPVRRHAYLQQLFSKPFFKETEELDVNSLVETINSDTQSFSFISNSLKILSSFQGTKDMGVLYFIFFPLDLSAHQYISAFILRETCPLDIFYVHIFYLL